MQKHDHLSISENPKANPPFLEILFSPTFPQLPETKLNEPWNRFYGTFNLGIRVSGSWGELVFFRVLNIWGLALSQLICDCGISVPIQGPT